VYQDLQSEVLLHGSLIIGHQKLPVLQKIYGHLSTSSVIVSQSVSFKQTHVLEHSQTTFEEQIVPFGQEQSAAQACHSKTLIIKLQVAVSLFQSVIFNITS
jgi:hypothetical protein